MKLEPVYLVAPPRRMTTRRAFLFAVGAACGGCVVGFGGGWVARGWAAGDEGSGGAGTVDPRLTFGLQVAAPSSDIELLLKNEGLLISLVRETERVGNQQPVLWEAMARIAREVVANPNLPSRARRARTILDLMRLPYPSQLGLDDIRPDLLRIAGK